MTPREEAKNKAIQLFDKASSCVGAGVDPGIIKNIVSLIIDEVLQTNPTIKGNSDDFITTIVQTKAHYYLIKEELEKL